MKLIQSTLKIMEEFYAVIKLISGEEIFSLISYDDTDNDILINLKTPIVIEPIISNRNNVNGYKVKSWMNIPNDEYYVIKMSSVITMTEVTDNTLISIYNKFNNSSSKISLDHSMGFISTVHDAKIYLEDMLSLS